VRSAFRWVESLAGLLANPGGRPAAVAAAVWYELRRTPRRAWREPGLRAAIKHLRRVARSYWPGLFHCYAVADLPRTNNALEQLFGSHRHHERRCTGRKAASPGLVLRGPVRLVAGVASRLGPVSGESLRPPDIRAWRALRGQLERRRQARACRHRFRRDPGRYLADLEAQWRQRALPP
jgi:hypothetical protein